MVRHHDGDDGDPAPTSRPSPEQQERAQAEARAHDLSTDIHIYHFKAGGGLIHPHNAAGWEWLAGRLGIDEMLRYQEEELYHPTIAEPFDVAEEAERDGFIVQHHREP